MKRRFLAVALVFLALLAGPEKPLRDCLWVDRLDRGPRDPYREFYFGPEGWGYMVEGQSRYKLQFEIFEFCEEDGRINFHFHHDDRKPSCTYRIEGQRLTIEDDPNGGRVYFQKMGLTGGRDLSIARLRCQTH